MSKPRQQRSHVLLADLLMVLEDGRYMHQGWSPKCMDFSSTSDEAWGVLKTTAIQDGKYLPEHNKQLPSNLAPRPLLEVHSGDILLTCAGPRIRCGVPCLVRTTRPRLMISGKMYRLRVREPEVNSRFVEAMLRAPETQKVIDTMKTGISESGMNLTHERFAKLTIPLFPTNEQKRIADKLDAVLAQVDACRERLDLVPTILKRFRQSVVSAAVSGRLTEDWRAQQSTNADTSQRISTPLADLCIEGRVITYGVIKLGSETPNGIPCLRTSNVRWLRIDTDGMKRIKKKLSEEYSRTILEGSEVLVNVRGTLGGVAVASTEMRGWNVSREVAVVPADNTKADSDFLALWIASESSQRWLSNVERGVAYVGINIEDLRALPVELPSIGEQREIVRRVQSLFAYADRLEANYVTARAKVEKLAPALLAKAFRGELVPQDPNDEPASDLLKRIHQRSSDICTSMSKKVKKTSVGKRARKIVRMASSR